MRGLEKNRVFSVSKIEGLNRAGCGMLSTGSSVCETCDSAVSALEGLIGQVPGEAKSALLQQSLSQVKRPLAKPEYEHLNLRLGRTLGKLAAGIPGCDADGAQAVEASTQTLQMSAAMIKDLMNYIELAGTDINSVSFEKALERYSGAWQETTLSLNKCMEYARTILKGLPANIEFYGDPVNMATGNFTYSYTDLTVKGSLPLKFSRFYNAMDKNDGVLGRGWIHNWETRLLIQEDAITLIHEDGREEPLRRKDETTYESSRDGQTEITLLGEAWCWRRKDSLLVLFDREGRMIRLMNEELSGIALLYEDGALKKIQADTGDTLTLSYNERGQLVTVADHTGREIHFTYDKKKLTGVTDPEGQTMNYSYGKNGRIESILDKRGVPVLQNSYDEHRRITAQTFPDGGVMKYEYMDERNRLQVTEQNGNRITYIHDDTLRSTRTDYEDGSELYTYDDQNNCTSRTDKRNNTTAYAYDEKGRLISVTDPLSNTSRAAYDEEGRLRLFTGADGSTRSYRYDEKGRLEEITDELGAATRLAYEGERRYPERITLPDEGEMKLSYDQRGNILSIEYPDGRAACYAYDRLGRVIQSTDGEGNRTAYAYDGMDRLTKTVRADGKERTYEYNPMGEAVRITDFDGYPAQWEYNVLNKPERYTDKEGRTTLMEYDKMWSLAKITDPEGSETTYTYDHLKRLTRATDPLGRSVAFTYDACGNRTAIRYPDGTVRSFEYDELNRKIKETDEKGGVIRTFYDSMGRIIKTIDQEGGETTCTYDRAGNKIQETGPAGETTTYTYTPIGKAETITHPGGRVESFRYQRGGKLLKHDKGDGTWESYTYDKAGNILTREYEDGSITAYTYDCLGRVTRISRNGMPEKTYTYDAMGNILTMEDALGNQTRYSYSPEGNLTGVTDPEGNRVLYAYNGRDELTALLQLSAQDIEQYSRQNTGAWAGSTACGQDRPDRIPDKDLWEITALNHANNPLHLTLFQRNPAGQIETVTNALGQKETYRYDEMGRVVSRTDREGAASTFTYYPGGALKEAAYPDGRSVLLSYDALNRLSRIKDWLGETLLEYDRAGRITKVTDHGGDVTAYGWNPDGTRKWLQYPDGRKACYEYDSLTRLTAITSGDHTITYRYDESGRLTECSRGNGIKSLYSYNGTGLISTLTHTNGTDILEQLSYRYDKAGNPVWVQRQSRERDYSFTREYTYDRNNRLTRVTKDHMPIRDYTYDGYGNRTALTEYTLKEHTDGAAGESALPIRTEYRYNPLNQLTEMGEKKYSYTLNGGLRAETQNGQEKYSCRYDSLGRLTHIFHEGELIQQNEYDGLGNRAGSLFPKEQEGESNVRCCIDHIDAYARILMEKGQSEHTYLWQGSDLWGIPEDNAYVLTDALHTPIQLTDTQGETRNIYRYNEYGVLEKSREELPFPFGFTGYKKEKAENLYFANAREYNGLSGSFLTKDQSCYIDYRNPGTVNLYQYVQGNPLRYVDYDGHECIEEKDYYSRLFKASPKGNEAGKYVPRDAKLERLIRNVKGVDYPADMAGDMRRFTLGLNQKKISWLSMNNALSGRMQFGSESLVEYVSLVRENENDIDEGNEKQKLVGRRLGKVASVMEQAVNAALMGLKVALDARMTNATVGVAVAGVAGFESIDLGEKEHDNVVQVTMSQMKEYELDVTEERVEELNSLLIEYNITSDRSFTMFIATVKSEIGQDKGGDLLEDGSEEYFIEQGYDSNTCGAGYMQITGDDQVRFLLYIKEKEEESAKKATKEAEIDAISETIAALNEALKEGANRAEFIANNYAWESAIWEWAVDPKGDNVIMNEYVDEHKDSPGEKVFLVTQYFINSYLNKEDYPDFDNDLAYIRKTGEGDYYYNEKWVDNKGKEYIGTVHVNGRDYRLPLHYRERKENYEDAVEIFGEG